MSITTEISRIKNAADVIKTKTVSLGLTDDGKSVSSTDKIEVHADAINQIVKNPSVGTISTPKGSVTIPRGYYDGTTSATASVPVNYYYTGETTPENTLGNNGDFFLVI